MHARTAAPDDPDAPLDLQQLLTVAFDRAAYDLTIDYAREPVPPLGEGERAWANQLLCRRGLRPAAPPAGST